ncbi:CPBP family glutamic-type intramembrane protease, partial [Candidatus Hodarchaeum mangrovi]
ANLANSGILLALIQGIIVISTEDDITILNLVLNIIAQIGATAIFLFLYRSQKIEVEEKKAIPAPYLALIPILFSMLEAISFVLVILLTPFGPVISAYEDILPSPTLLYNPLYYFLLFGVLCVGAAISEELIFRRSLIPMLERRGIGSFWALLISSLFFSIIHMPADIIQGTLIWTLMHFAGTFIGGLAMGYIYLRTRQIRWPILLHAFINGIGGISSIAQGFFDYYQEFYLLSIVTIWSIIALTIGFAALSYSFIQFIQRRVDQNPPEWIKIVTDTGIQFNKFKIFFGISFIFLLLEAILPVVLNQVFEFIESTITVSQEYLLLKTIIISLYHIIIVILLFYLVYRQLSPLKEANWVEKKYPEYYSLDKSIVTTIERMQNFCGECGKNIIPNTSYCVYCGTRLIQENKEDTKDGDKMQDTLS